MTFGIGIVVSTLSSLQGHTSIRHRPYARRTCRCVYEKKIPDHFPDWIERVQVEVKERHQRQDQVVCNDAAALVYLADQACITPHIWLSRVDRLHCPDRMVFDLDPPGEDFEAVRFAARVLRDLLEELDLVSFLLTTGSSGLHVVVRRHAQRLRSHRASLDRLLQQRG